MKPRRPSFNYSKTPVLGRLGLWLCNRERKNQKADKSIKHIVSLKVNHFLYRSPSFTHDIKMLAVGIGSGVFVQS